MLTVVIVKELKNSYNKMRKEFWSSIFLNQGRVIYFMVMKIK